MKTTKKLIYSLASLLSVTLLVPSVFAAITITPSIAPGTYDHALELELNSSDPAAKVFYSFNPNGGPNDAFAYTGAITLKSSTSFVYFGFVALDNESKVLIDDYIIEYPSASFDSGSILENNILEGLKITNTSEKDLNLSHWKVRSQDFVFEIPKDTVIKKGDSYMFPDVPLTDGKAALLMSPDEEEKDIIVGASSQGQTPVEKPVITPVKKVFTRSTVRELAPEVWIKPKITATETPVTSVVSTDVSTPPVESPAVVTPDEVTTAPELAPTIAPEVKTDTPLSDNLKIAVNESNTTSTTAPWVILGIIVVAGGAIGVRFALKK